MLIFAHRGMKKELPENTMPAFKKAFSDGFGIEFDLRMTLDKRIVVIHDKNLSRITRHQGDVSSLSLDELSSLDAGSHFDPAFADIRIPTFEEVCDLATSNMALGQKAAIHIKHDEQTDEMLESISSAFKKYDLYQRAFIFDLTFQSVKSLKKINSKIPVALSVAENHYGPTVYQWEDVIPFLDQFENIWLDEWKIQGSVLNEPLIGQMKKAGKQVYVISPELHREHNHPGSERGYEAVWKDLGKWGIDGICTAYPNELKEVLTSVGKFAKT